MDPDEALATLRELVENHDGNPEAEILATHFTALDTWMSNQGFLPADWARGRR